MKFDFYTKIILTIIAFGVFIPMLTNPPVTNKAIALGNNNGMITSDGTYIYQLKGDKIRVCKVTSWMSTKCGIWSD